MADGDSSASSADGLDGEGPADAGLEQFLDGLPLSFPYFYGCKVKEIIPSAPKPAEYYIRQALPLVRELLWLVGRTPAGLDDDHVLTGWDLDRMLVGQEIDRAIAERDVGRALAGRGQRPQLCCPPTERSPTGYSSARSPVRLPTAR